MNSDATREPPGVARKNLRRWLLAIAVVLIGATFLLHRVHAGQLFIVALPFDREPAPSEVEDARATVRMWFVPALLFLIVGGTTVALTSRSTPPIACRQLTQKVAALVRAQAWLVAFFAMACLLDFYTTWAYAQQFSLEDEVHPGIKLVTYAFGITVGVVVGKAIQAGLVLAIAAVWPRTGRVLLLFVTGGYFVAAAWNTHAM